MEQQTPTFEVTENATKYEILGVDLHATDDEIRVAFRRLALLYHPDRHPEAECEATSNIFARIASAYATLSEPEKRRRYDLALSRNEDYRDDTEDKNVVSLADILAGINAYEHVFSESSLIDVSTQLHDIVQRNLIGGLGEEIVEAWPLPAAPSGAKYQGSFSKGALVLTNLRVLFPYTFTWQETDGNVTTTYTGAEMPSLPLPMLDHIAVVVEKRVKRKLLLDFYVQGEKIRISPRLANLSKLFLVAQLWGVQLEARQDEAKWRELRWALWKPWQNCLILFGLVFAAAAIVGLLGDSIVDNMADLSDFLRRWGVWQWAAVLFAAICGRRLSRWVFAYSAVDLADSLRVQDGPGTHSPVRSSDLVRAEKH